MMKNSSADDDTNGGYVGRDDDAGGDDGGDNEDKADATFPCMRHLASTRPQVPQPDTSSLPITEA